MSTENVYCIAEQLLMSGVKGACLPYQHVCVSYLALGQSLGKPSKPIRGEADVVYHIATVVAELMCESVTSKDVLAGDSQGLLAPLNLPFARAEVVYCRLDRHAHHIVTKIVAF